MNLGTSSGRLDSLTSLRFFAALFVVLLHAGSDLSPFPGFEKIFSLGYVGVTFFFILSGVVLAWTYREGDKAGGFYGRRIARVWPLHVVTTLAAAALIAGAGGQQSPVALLFIVPMLHSFVPSSSIYYGYNGLSWTLSCEAFFYLLFPILILWAGRNRKPLHWMAGIFLAMCATVAVVLAAAPQLAAMTGFSAEAFGGYFLNIFPGYRLGEFAIGVLLGVLLRRGWRSPVTINQAVALTLAVLAALTVGGWLLFGSAADLSLPIVGLILVIPFALLIASAASSDLQGYASGLQASLLVRLGEASFALYLVHHLILQLFGPVADGMPDATRWLVTIAAVGVSLGVAEAAHRWIEKPAERYLRARIGRREAAAVPG